jgi:aspartyl protease family protein
MQNTHSMKSKLKIDFIINLLLLSFSSRAQTANLARYESIVPLLKLYMDGKKYEIHQKLSEIGFGPEDVGSGNQWELFYSPKKSEMGLSFFAFGKMKFEKATLYTVELHVLEDEEYRKFVESKLENQEKTEPNWGKILDGYEVRLSKYSGVYYGMRGKRFIHGAHDVKMNDIENLNEQNGDDRKTIKLIRNGNLLEVPVRLNDVITLNFIFDTGASDISIPIDVFTTLIKTGTLNESDLIGSKQYKFANGKTEIQKVFRLKQLDIGELSFSNVEISVSPTPDSPLLLGQSLISKFGKYFIDYDENLLTIE